MSDCFNVYEIPGCHIVGAYLPTRPAMPFGRVPIQAGGNPRTNCAEDFTPLHFLYHSVKEVVEGLI